MRRLLSILCVLAAGSVLALAQPSRVVTAFDKDWRFIQADPAGAQAPGFADKSWRRLDLPHDWSLEGENLQDNPGGGGIGFFPMGTGWYRKSFDVPGYSKDTLYSIEFDGIYMNSTVWVNGVCLGTWPYGYSSFSYDLTPVLKARGNVIAVRVDNSQQPNSRWYSGSGIYRHVRLVATSKTRFDKWGVFHYTTSVDEGTAKVLVRSDITNGEARARELTVRQTVLDASGAVVATVEKPVGMVAGGSQTVDLRVEIPGAQLWDTENPYLYTLRSQLLASGKEIDCVEGSLGVRTIEYDVDRGFLLNGKQVKMKGVNLHQDHAEL